MCPVFFEKVVIVGPGLIGGSLGMALRRDRLAGELIGVGHRESSLDRAQRRGAIDEGTLDMAEAVTDAGLVVLATRVGKIIESAREVIPHMKTGALLTDVGSVKRAICKAVAQAVERSGRSDIRFVGAHPLAGSEQRGIDAARGDLFRGALCLLTPEPGTDPSGTGLAEVRALWQAVGCRVKQLPPDVHDRLLAEISHLPHAVAACLIQAVSEDALALAGRGFMDTTRVASGDPGLWLDICTANGDTLVAALRGLAAQVNAFADELAAGNTEAILKRLTNAKVRRDARLHEPPLTGEPGGERVT